MKLDNLTYPQLRQICRWCDWAEHHAMYEHARAAETAKYLWSIEIKDLAQVQKEIRELAAASPPYVITP